MLRAWLTHKQKIHSFGLKSTSNVDTTIKCIVETCTRVCVDCVRVGREKAQYRYTYTSAFDWARISDAHVYALLVCHALIHFICSYLSISDGNYTKHRVVHSAYKETNIMHVWNYGHVHKICSKRRVAIFHGRCMCESARGCMWCAAMLPTNYNR